jgi:MFS family permease
MLAFVLLPDSFRKERSMAYISARKRHHGDQNFRVSLADVNPLSAVGRVLRRLDNVLVLLCCGILYGAQVCYYPVSSEEEGLNLWPPKYSLSFTASRALAAAPWNYSPVKIGLVLMSYGFGNAIGSIVGGRYSDKVLARLKRKNDGIGSPDMRLQSIYIAIPWVPISFAA